MAGLNSRLKKTKIDNWEQYLKCFTSRVNTSLEVDKCHSSWFRLCSNDKQPGDLEVADLTVEDRAKELLTNAKVLYF